MQPVHMAIDPGQIIRFLWQTGHFWNPSLPDTWNVAEQDLATLKLHDRVVQDAVRSYQHADANLLPIVRTYHGRDPIADGDFGPATALLMTIPRCPVPDHVPPRGVTFADPVMRQIVETMQDFTEQRATGSGGWPASGCDPERKGIHSIRVSIDPRNAPSSVKAYLEEAVGYSRAAYAEIGISVRYLLEATNDAEIIKKFEPLAGNVIGWNEFPRANSCSKISGRLDSTYAPDMKRWANLETHETGHGVGLEHTNGSIMNPSLLLIWPITWKGSPSFNTLKRYYGGEPIDVPTPPPPPTGGGRVSVTVEVDDSGAVPTAKIVSVTRKSNANEII